MGCDDSSPYPEDVNLDCTLTSPSLRLENKMCLTFQYMITSPDNVASVNATFAGKTIWKSPSVNQSVLVHYVTFSVTN